MEQIIGSLDSKLAEIYSDLIDEDILTQEQGGMFIVSLNGEHAIKHPHYESEPADWPAQVKVLIREYEIGSELGKQGVNVPEMHGVYTGTETKMPFLVMQRLHLTKLEDLNRADKTEAKTKYDEQITLAEKAGYIPGDVSECDNCGFDKKTRMVWFYDLEDWEKK